MDFFSEHCPLNSLLSIKPSSTLSFFVSSEFFWQPSQDQAWTAPPTLGATSPIFSPPLPHLSLIWVTVPLFNFLINFCSHRRWTLASSPPTMLYQRDMLSEGCLWRATHWPCDGRSGWCRQIAEAALGLWSHPLAPIPASTSHPLATRCSLQNGLLSLTGL